MIQNKLGETKLIVGERVEDWRRHLIYQKIKNKTFVFIRQVDYCRTNDKKRRNNIMIQSVSRTTAESFFSVHQSYYTQTELDTSLCRARGKLMSSTRQAHIEHATSSYWVRDELMLSTHETNYIVRAMHLPWSIVLNNLCG